MDYHLILTGLVLVFGFYMAWNIGANDVSNAMGTSVGSGALTLRRAVIIAAILEFSGAYFIGGNVSETMQKGLIEVSAFAEMPNILMLGFCSALLGTGVWLQVASYFGWPVSTTHAIVGAIVGFGAVVGGPSAVHWNEVGNVASSWVISPILSGIIAYLIFTFLQQNIFFSRNPIKATKKIFPFLVFIFLGTFSLSMLFNGLKNANLNLKVYQSVAIAGLIAFTGAMISYFLLRRKKVYNIQDDKPRIYSSQNVTSLDKAVKHLRRVSLGKDDLSKRVFSLMKEVKGVADDVRTNTSPGEITSEFQIVERKFIYLQIMSACFIAFAHGANDVGNAMGPVAAVINILKNGGLTTSSEVPSWILLLGGVGIVIGLATWGYKVIDTVGKKITQLTPTRGFSAEFGAGTTILLASKLGLPVSTTHCLVGAVLGVGMAHGFRALNLNMVKEIILSWVVTIPASAITSITFFYLLKRSLSFS